MVKSRDGDYLTVEEKIDGANLGFRLTDDGRVIAQNRSHVVHSKYHAQFAKLDKYINDNAEVLRRVLRDQNQILYGEWVYALHSTAYDRLPGYFVAFDLRCVLTDTFVSRSELQAMLLGTGIPLTPLLWSKPAANTSVEAKLMMKEVLDLVNRKSSFAADTQAEGVYVRVQNDRSTTDRAKLVRPHFIPGNEHWSRGIITVLQLSPEARERQMQAAMSGCEDVACDAPAFADVAVELGTAVGMHASQPTTDTLEHTSEETSDAADLPHLPEPQLHRASSKHKEMLVWLTEQLTELKGQTDAECLLLGVEALLSDDETAFEEVMENVSNTLRGEDVPEELLSEFSGRARTLL